MILFSNTNRVRMCLIMSLENNSTYVFHVEKELLFFLRANTWLIDYINLPENVVPA